MIADGSGTLATYQVDSFMSPIDTEQSALRVNAISPNPANPAELLLALDSASENPLSHLAFLN